MGRADVPTPRMRSRVSPARAARWHLVRVRVRVRDRVRVRVRVRLRLRLRARARARLRARVGARISIRTASRSVRVCASCNSASAFRSLVSSARPRFGCVASRLCSCRSATCAASAAASAASFSCCALVTSSTICFARSAARFSSRIHVLAHSSLAYSHVGHHALKALTSMCPRNSLSSVRLVVATAAATRCSLTRAASTW